MLTAGVHAYLRSDANVRVGPFSVRFDEHDDSRDFNYAVPDDGAEPTAGEVGALVAAFRERSRTPRLEYVPLGAPKVEGVLLEAGFTPEGRYPLLVCDPRAVVEKPGVRVELVTEDEDLWRVARVMNVAFEVPEAGAHDVARLRGILDGGGLVAAAVDEDGNVVGGGQIGAPHEGVAEVAAIAVLPSHRRRGIAGAVTALVTRAGGEVGITTPFLTPASDEAGRVYERVGYRRVGEALYISLPA